MPFLWLRRGAPAWYLLPGVLSLLVFAWLLTLHPETPAGRVYAAYGGVYVATTVLWLWLVDGQAVGRDKNGIGYGGVAYFAAVPLLKVLPIKKTDTAPAVSPLKDGKPNYDVVWSGDYPIARWLYMYTTGKPTPEEKAYLDWILGQGGQQVVADIEYIPLKGVLASAGTP